MSLVCHTCELHSSFVIWPLSTICSALRIRSPRSTSLSSDLDNQAWTNYLFHLTEATGQTCNVGWLSGVIVANTRTSHGEMPCSRVSPTQLASPILYSRSTLDPNLLETIACGTPDWRHHTGAPAREEAGESWWGSSRSQATLPTAKSARILACFWVDAHGSIKQQIRDEHEVPSLQFLEAVMPAHYHQQSNPPQRAQLSSLATDTLGLACPNLATNCYFIKGLPHTVMKKAPNGSRKRKMYRGSSEPRTNTSSPAPLLGLH